MTYKSLYPDTVLIYLTTTENKAPHGDLLNNQIDASRHSVFMANQILVVIDRTKYFNSRMGSSR